MTASELTDTADRHRGFAERVLSRENAPEADAEGHGQWLQWFGRGPLD